jgi:hypothetical protein
MKPQKIIIFALAAALSGCAHMANRAYDQKMEAFREWLAAEKPLVESGSQKRSDFWIEYYNRVSAPPNGPLDLPLEEFANEMVPVARKFEAGEITRDDYDQARREHATEMGEKIQNLQDQAAAADQQRRQAVLQYYLQTRPHTTNCTAFGNSASCTSN